MTNRQSRKVALAVDSYIYENDINNQPIKQDSSTLEMPQVSEQQRNL